MRRTTYWKKTNRTDNGILSRAKTVVKAIIYPWNQPFGWDERRLDFMGDRLAGAVSLSLVEKACMGVRFWGSFDVVGGTSYTSTSLVQDVGVDHRRCHVLVAEELVDSSDVVSYSRSAWGYFLARAPGSFTCPAPAFRSISCCCLTKRRCSFSLVSTETGPAGLPLGEAVRVDQGMAWTERW